MELNPDQLEEYRKLFIKIIVSNVYKRAISSIEEILDKVPNWKKPPDDLVKFHHWYNELPEVSQKTASALVTYCVDSAVFDLLTYLDAVQLTPDPLEDSVSDFAVYLQTYDSKENKYNNSFSSQIRINTFGNFNDLHDEYTFALEDEDE